MRSLDACAIHNLHLTGAEAISARSMLLPGPCVQPTEKEQLVKSGRCACAGDEQFKEEKAVIIKEISSLKPSGGSRGASPVPVYMSVDGGRTSA